MAIAVGTVTSWDAVAVVNGSTRLATTYANNGQVVIPRLYTLGTGVRLNYDNGDATVMEGKIVQEFIDDSGATFIDAQRAKLGEVGILVLTDTAGSPGTETNSIALLTKVEDVTPVQGSRDKVWCRMTWEILGAWT